MAHAQHGLAAMLLARGAPGNRNRARELVDVAVGAYEELGMGPWAARCASHERGGAAPRRD